MSDNGESQEQDQRLQAVQDLGQPGPPPRLEGGIHCLPIIGQIEGHVLLPPKAKTTKYEHVIPQLVAVEQNPQIKGLLVLLNTVGGDIEAGLAIAEMIKGLSKPTVSLILGGGHSIGGPIAVAADRSFIAGSATVTIHPIRLTGLVVGVPQTYEYLDKMQDRVIRFIVDNARISELRLRELMFRTGELMRDVGTVLIGSDAVSVGLIDELGGLSESIAYLRRLIDSGGLPQPDKTSQPKVQPQPSVSPQPAVSPQPTISPPPTVSPQPSVSPQPTVSPQPAVSPEPTVSPQPAITPQPTAPPQWPGPYGVPYAPIGPQPSPMPITPQGPGITPYLPADPYSSREPGSE